MTSRSTRKGPAGSGGLQQALDEALAEVPRALAIELFRTKLSDAGVGEVDIIATALTEHLLTDPEADFEWLDAWGDPPEKLAELLSISDEDMAFVDWGFRSFTDEQLPTMIETISERTSRSMVMSMKRRWPEEHARQEHDLVGFKMRMEQRWGKAFAAFRMLLTVSRELGEGAHNRRRTSRSKKDLHRTDVMIRLHARACQVASEVLALMESGFADGAMARWRTLHEIAVVMTLISQHDDELARRYLVHEVVESKRGLDLYRRVYPELGYQPPTDQEIARVESLFAAALAEFGKPFGTPNGWASKHLGISDPKFSDLEKAADRVRMRSHYKMASQSVHAGTKGIAFKLGAMGDRAMILAGASNAGLVEPGQNAAITLTQITVMLVGTKGLDELTTLRALKQLQEDAVRAFVLAHRKLKREESEKAVSASRRKGSRA